MIRLGRIGYVNMAPVFYRLEAEVDEVVGVPTELNQCLLSGECDLAPISSIEYARNADRLRILPRLCVSSEGAVDSIQLVSRVPLEHVRVVAVTRCCQVSHGCRLNSRAAREGASTEHPNHAPLAQRQQRDVFASSPSRRRR